MSKEAEPTMISHLTSCKALQAHASFPSGWMLFATLLLAGHCPFRRFFLPYFRCNMGWFIALLCVTILKELARAAGGFLEENRMV